MAAKKSSPKTAPVTPPAKRDPNAFEVVASKDTTSQALANVQCACRECNLWKSDKIVVGQANLFL